MMIARVRLWQILLQKWVAPMGGRPFRYERPALIGRR